MNAKRGGNDVVLVGVLNRKRDLQILLAQHWYRIPLSSLPRKRFQYLAFYQPAAFGRQGSRIRYYGRVVRRDKRLRLKLLPHESRHPNAAASYLRVRVDPILRLPRPITNAARRRVSFGFATLPRLKASRTVLELYNVAATEELLGRALAKAGIRAIPQYPVVRRGKGNQRQYILDFVIFSKHGVIAIECDNIKAHSSKRQHQRDRAKDTFLRRRGWNVLRLSEDDILLRLDDQIQRIRRLV